MARSTDPEQMPHFVTSDLGLQYFTGCLSQYLQGYYGKGVRDPVFCQEILSEGTKCPISSKNCRTVPWKQGKKLAPTREIVPLGHLRTAKAKIRLHGCAVRSQPLLFTNRIIDYHRMDQQRAKAQMRLCHLRRMILCPVCACSKTLFCLTWLKWLIHNSRWADKHFSVFQQKSIFFFFFFCTKTYVVDSSDISNDYNIFFAQIR